MVVKFTKTKGGITIDLGLYLQNSAKKKKSRFVIGSYFGLFGWSVGRGRETTTESGRIQVRVDGSPGVTLSLDYQPGVSVNLVSPFIYQVPDVPLPSVRRGRRRSSRSSGSGRVCKVFVWRQVQR